MTSVLVGVPWLDDAAAIACGRRPAGERGDAAFCSCSSTFRPGRRRGAAPGRGGADQALLPLHAGSRRSRPCARRGCRGRRRSGPGALRQALAAEDNFSTPASSRICWRWRAPRWRSSRTASWPSERFGALRARRVRRHPHGRADTSRERACRPPEPSGRSRGRMATIPIFAADRRCLRGRRRRRRWPAGMNAHVAKPLEIDELRRAVDRFVEKGTIMRPIASKRVRKGPWPAVALVGALVLGACSAPAPAGEFGRAGCREERTVNFFQPHGKISPRHREHGPHGQRLTIAMAEGGSDSRWPIITPTRPRTTRTRPTTRCARAGPQQPGTICTC